MASFFRCSLLFIWMLISCTVPSRNYEQFYRHLDYSFATRTETAFDESKCFLVVLVDARHLDYTNNFSFLKSIAQNRDGTPNGWVGHAWIYLNGWIDGEHIVIEGGHSGELGLVQSRYFDGVMEYNDSGDENPIRYLWISQMDGFFQKGCGQHKPTFAAKVNITADQFKRIVEFVKQDYSYETYALTGDQCTSFVEKVAELAQWSISSQITLSIQPHIFFRGQCIRFWKDPRYRTITFGSPDVLEKNLIQAVEEGRAEYALDWYALKRFRINTTQN